VAGESAPEPRRITDRQRNKEHELEKRPTERYRKSRMAKNGNGNLKKKKKKKKKKNVGIGNQLLLWLLVVVPNVICTLLFNKKWYKWVHSILGIFC
jgi:hypothetical protein